MKTVYAPDELRQPMDYVFPESNSPDFEQFFSETFWGAETDRYYIDLWWTSLYVNRGYVKDLSGIGDVQKFMDGLSRQRKYFTICQYDFGLLVDLDGLDILQFNMSNNVGYPLPLMCQPHIYKMDTGYKRHFANFMGSLASHPIRGYAKDLEGKSEYVIEFEYKPVFDFCKTLAASTFTLCFRGVGLNSFRISEAMQYNSIPVQITNEPIHPHNIDFNEYGVLILEKDAHRIDEILKAIPPEVIAHKQKQCQKMYQYGYTFQGCMDRILQYLEKEKKHEQKKSETNKAVC